MGNNTLGAGGQQPNSLKGQSAQIDAQQLGGGAASSELSKEVEDTKEKLKIITQKFAAARKERDQLKTDNKEL